MKGLYVLWKINTVIVVLQILVGAGMWAILPHVPDPPETLLEHAVVTLTSVMLLTMLFGAMSGYGAAVDIFLPLPVAWASAFTLFIVVCAMMVRYDALLFAASLLAAGPLVIMCVSMIASFAHGEDAVKAPKWEYAVTALPLGLGSILGGILILLRRWHSPQSLQKIS